jgi:hypothetical protein
MTAPRGTLCALALLTLIGAADGLAAQANADSLGTARGCSRSRIGVSGTVTPVTAESHTFLGRFVGSFARHMQPSLRDVHGDVRVGVGGPAPLAVAFAVKRPIAEPLLPELQEDRLAPAQHRALFTGIRSALAEIRGTPATSFAIALRIEGRC